MRSRVREAGQRSVAAAGLRQGADARSVNPPRERQSELEEHYAALFAYAPVGIARLSLNRRIEVVNDAFCEIFGYARDELVGRRLREIAYPEDHERTDAAVSALIASKAAKSSIEKRFVRRDGGIVWVRMTMAVLRGADGTPTHRIVVMEDIGPRKQAEARLAYLAQFDSLTGLANRTLLNDRLSQAIAQANRLRSMGAVLFVDLDRFKLVNDTLGHAIGDQLLVETGRRLRACVRDGDTVARISGDEFAVVLTNLTRPEDAGVVAQKVLASLSAPYQLNGREVLVSASIGVATFPQDGQDAGTLLTNADTAMYGAKESGRNSHCFFTQDMNQRSLHKLGLAAELRLALQRGEFRLHYQPRVNLADGVTVLGLEALLRWQHPAHGMIAPAGFIAVLEETGLIIAAGEWVLRETCRQLRAWQDAGRVAVPVAVNLSARQFRDQGLVGMLRDLSAAAGIEPRLIELEITESLLVENPTAARRTLDALRAAGFSITVDDFGTGYSSLAYLTQFPLAALKIDQSFVRNLRHDDNAASVVRAIITMAQSLRFRTVAEGVEKDSQAAYLRQFGCNEAQGYLFCRPLDAESVEHWLTPQVACNVAGTAPSTPGA